MRPQNEMNKKIADAFYTVLKNTAFAKAKVTTITKAAGISHQTFYRYYLDKYDLALKIATEKFYAFHDIYSDNATWKEIVTLILNSIKNYPVFFKKLLADPEGAQIVQQGIISVTENFSGEGVSGHSAAVWISILKEWSQADFRTPIEDIYEKLKLFTPVTEVLTAEEIEKIMGAYENQTLHYFKERANKRLS